MRLVRVDTIAPLVHSVRGEKVLFDADLAVLYGVTTKAPNQAVKRNRRRFPEDFMFRLPPNEWERMRSQIVTASPRRNIGTPPYVFTEKKYDEQFAVVFDAIKRLIAEDESGKANPKRRIGFI